MKSSLNSEGLLRVLSIGAGAVGSYVGGSLDYFGNHVVYLEQPAVAPGLKARGLRLKINQKEIHIPDPKIATTLGQAISLGPFDVAIIALKAYDTFSILVSLTEYSDQIPPILCLQNGVDNEITIAASLGAEKVIPGTLTSSIGRKAAGDIILEKLRGIGVAAGHPLSTHLVDVLNQAGLKARLYSQSSGMKWSKMLTNQVGNASSAILNMSPTQVFTHPELFEIEMRQLRETLAVMDAQGIRVVNLPGTPIRLLSFVARYLPDRLSRIFLTQAIGSGRGRKMPSFYLDLYSGCGKSEVVFLNGAVCEYGRRYNIPTPANRFLTDTLMSLTIGEIALDTYAHNHQKFVQDFKVAYP